MSKPATTVSLLPEWDGCMVFVVDKAGAAVNMTPISELARNFIPFGVSAMQTLLRNVDHDSEVWACAVYASNPSEYTMRDNSSFRWQWNSTHKIWEKAGQPSNPPLMRVAR